MQPVTKVSFPPKRTGVDLTRGILKFMVVQLLVVVFLFLPAIFVGPHDQRLSEAR